MGWFPMFLKITDARCLVVGGGKVAYRKVESLLHAGASIEVLSADFCKELVQIAEANPSRIQMERGTYTSRDLSIYQLVIAATDDPQTNRLVYEDAQRARVLVNVVDVPELCTAQAAAVVRRGPLQIAIHTGGECPALAAAIRQELEKLYPTWLGDFAEALGEIRQELLTLCPDSQHRKRILQTLADTNVRDNCRHLSRPQMMNYLSAEMHRLLKNT
ncbi:MAG TPA: bifunctional precorrin-2 dehydrogenase/sirohydrochlorin ferrochelatase [Candidatus Hydrogenedentes bacterium]|nr:bifunctional precorrin-2 dehydrogenase/sirohydrochlorin ferrochelatase [Candidatus Hydrogenedentota bacterium]HOL76890.1 bifunctional precorrin-2 dehydrogenase/sirohydrochlorin ferrochelatase [Candidatus Hydrogenedentota bacterium]HPO85542.1 bifunctional precorrin-2 dehydrogenase/sirohydrochlorin ferrochelatase [Candidatus Hydrogenedentota bacterium]